MNNGEVNVLGFVHFDTSAGQRNIAVSCGVCNRLSRKMDIIDYKYQRVQVLHEGDAYQRLQFCQWV